MVNKSEPTKSPYVIKLLIGLICLLLGGILLANTRVSGPALAQGTPNFKAEWKATKVLAMNISQGRAYEINPNKDLLPLGPSEWTVVYKELDGAGYRDIYREVWKIPEPNCYTNILPHNNNFISNCDPGYPNHGKWLYSIIGSGGTGVDWTKWTFESVDPRDARLQQVGNLVCKTRGTASIPGVDCNNVNLMQTTGAYGWVHGRYSNSDRGGLVHSGLMMPLEWSVEGYSL